MANQNVFTNYLTIRKAVAANDTALGATTWDTLPANRVKISREATSLKLMAYGVGTVNGTALVNIYGGHGQKPGQPAILLASITFTLGTMQCNYTPDGAERVALTSNFYFDTVTATGEGGVADVRVGNDSGNNRIGLAILRLTGESWIYAEIHTLTNINPITLVGTWVNETIPES